MNLDEARARTRALWQEMSSGWGRDSEWIWNASRRIGEWMGERAAPRLGDTVLELAAGSGETGFVAARLVGDDGRLISTDFAPGMVDAARARAARFGVTNAEFRVMDAENMDLPDASVDVVLCRWGLMLMLDPEKALTESRRVLRPGGRVALSTWGDPGRNPWATIVGRAFAAIGRPVRAVPEAPGGLFSMASTEVVRAMLARAGFDDIVVEEVEMAWTFADLDALWTFYTEVAGAVAGAINALDDDDRKRFRRALEDEVEAYRRGPVYELPGVCVNAAAS